MVLTNITDKPMSSLVYKYKLNCVEGHFVLQSSSCSPAATGHPGITDLIQLDEQGLRCVHVHVYLHDMCVTQVNRTHAACN